MPKHHDITNIEDVLETIEEAGDKPDRVSVDDMLKEIGTDAFPAIMLAPAVLLISPASGIPGLSSLCAVIIALTAVQMAIGRDSLWLPAFMRRRSVRRQTLEKAVHWLSRPAHYVDRFLGRRLTFLARKPFSLASAAACMVISLVIPVLELIPFSASIAGSAIAFFALGLVAGDGVLVLIGSVITTCAAAFGLSMLL